MTATLTLPIGLSAKGMAMDWRWNNRRKKLCIRTGSMGSTPDSLMSRNATTTVFCRSTKATPLGNSQVDANQDCHASFNGPEKLHT
jgi:hypothetical protein